jgi:hypothetical protein
VDDPPLGVAPLARQVEVARGVAVERHGRLVNQHLLDGTRPLADQLLDGRGVRHAVARLEDVPGERGRVGARVEDDAALGPVAVGVEGPRQGKQLAGKPGLRRLKGVGRAGEARADDQAVCAVEFHAP